MSYIRKIDDLSNLESLQQYKATSPDSFLQTETLKGLKNPKARLYFTPNRLRVYYIVEEDKKAPDFDDIGEMILKHYTEEDSDVIVTDNFDTFKSWVEEELSSFNISTKHIFDFQTQDGKNYEICKINLAEEIFHK